MYPSLGTRQKNMEPLQDVAVPSLYGTSAAIQKANKVVPTSQYFEHHHADG